MVCKLFIFSLIALTQVAYAGKPAACPGLLAIKTVGIEYVSLRGGVWAGYIFRNHYDTEQEWSFTIYGFSAKDEAEALKQANESITQLRLIDSSRNGAGGPCVYMGNEGNPELFAMANALS